MRKQLHHLVHRETHAGIHPGSAGMMAGRCVRMCMCRLHVEVGKKAGDTRQWSCCLTPAGDKVEQVSVGTWEMKVLNMSV